MKILKMFVSRGHGNSHYYCVFDKIPEVTYDKVGVDYVGSAVDKDGNIIFSHLLKKESFGNAFAGRELTLKMKDGSTEKIKDFWFDRGSHPEHGEFVSIGGNTLKPLQNCYVYYSYNINKHAFKRMLEDYYSREREYEYNEIEEWCHLQHKWYTVKIGGVSYPLMVNKFGDFVDMFTKKPVYPRRNIHKAHKTKNGLKWFPICLFELEYKEDGRLIRIQRKMIDVLRESLYDQTDRQIIKNCKLKEYTKGRMF